MNFRIGDRVICINDDFHAAISMPRAIREGWTRSLDGLEKGTVYTVRESSVQLGFPIVRLAEIVRPWPDNGYWSERFALVPQEAVERLSELAEIPV